MSLEALNRGAGERVGRLAQGCRHVLAIQDTTELNFQRHARRTQGLGPVGNGTDQGLFLHPVLAIAADGERCLGLASAKLWARRSKMTTGRRQRPMAQKESQRWQEGIAAAERVLGRPSWSRSSATAKRIFMKAGRGRGRPTCTCWRAPRKTARWSATLRCSPRATGSPSLAVTSLRCPGRPARRAKMELRFGTVELRRPRWLRRAPRLQEATPDSVMVHLVDVRECGACPGTEPPLHWRLLTTHAVDTPQAALRIVDWYRRRWNIEQLFWTLKRQGLDIEASQIESAQALIKLAFLATLAATRIMQLVRARDGATPTPAAEVFAAAEIEALSLHQPGLEGPTAKRKNPHPTGSLAWASWIIARLGGWKGYASESPPGPITMRHGLTRLEALREAHAMLRSVHW